MLGKFGGFGFGGAKDGSDPSDGTSAKVRPGRIAAIAGMGIGAAILASGSFGTVPSGTYHILQIPVTGKMEAKMTPGMYVKAFSSVTTWPVSETFFFTADIHEGAPRDQSIEVVFADGSMARISGTTRVTLPGNEADAVSIQTHLGFRSYEELESKLILPAVRNALTLTANFMTARESYSERKAEFVNSARDQILHGIYKTKEKEIEVNDPISGEKTRRKAREILLDDHGEPLRDYNPLANTGISLAQFEIKQIVYDDRVKLQIQKQQELAMAVATSRAEAEKAEQEKKTATAQGEARVTEAKYAKEQEKIRAVVDAEKDKAVAITGAERDKEVAETGGLKDKRVAELQRQAAEENKRRMILEGEGEAQKRKLIMEADGALTLKLDAYKTAMQAWAQAYSVRQVPQIVTGGGAGATGGEGGAQLMMEMLSIKAAKDLALDLSPGGHAPGKPQLALPSPTAREPLALPAPPIPVQKQ